jgi:hypothetical protein
MLFNGKSLPTVHSYSDCLVFRRKVHIRFGELHRWILYWNNWTLSKDPKQEQARADFWLKCYGPIDRTFVEQECVEVFEEIIQGFPFGTRFVPQARSWQYIQVLTGVTTCPTCMKSFQHQGSDVPHGNDKFSAVG